jgi:hypothetical protein
MAIIPKVTLNIEKKISAYSNLMSQKFKALEDRIAELEDEQDPSRTKFIITETNLIVTDFEEATFHYTTNALTDFTLDSDTIGWSFTLTDDSFTVQYTTEEYPNLTSIGVMIVTNVGYEKRFEFTYKPPIIDGKTVTITTTSPIVFNEWVNFHYSSTVDYKELSCQIDSPDGWEGKFGPTFLTIKYSNTTLSFKEIKFVYKQNTIGKYTFVYNPAPSFTIEAKYLTIPNSSSNITHQCPYTTNIPINELLLAGNNESWQAELNSKLIVHYNTPSTISRKLFTLQYAGNSYFDTRSFSFTFTYGTPSFSIPAGSSTKIGTRGYEQTYAYTTNVPLNEIALTDSDPNNWTFRIGDSDPYTNRLVVKYSGTPFTSTKILTVYHKYDTVKKSITTFAFTFGI